MLTSIYLKKIVSTNDKKRYELQKILNESTGKTELYIRATQGHTIKNIKDDELLTKIEDSTQFQTAVHGTYFKFWDSIKAKGLKTMSRNHIHFAPGYPGENQVISGMRSSCDLYIEIDLKKAMENGMKFYLSSNNVILTSGFDGVIPTKYFTRVIDRKGSLVFDSTSEEKKLDIEEEKLPQKAEEKDSLDYIFVLDFEAQCVNGSKLPVQEIIEFPVVPINLKTFKIEEPIFHYYIKPVVVPELTEFCRNLTGITQEQVNNGVILEKALELFEEFLNKNGFNGKKWVFCTCGEWDLNSCLKREASKKKIPLPDFFRRWINIKRVFQECLKLEHQVGMPTMLKMLGLELDGRHHSGIDDSRNIAKIAIELVKQKGVDFSAKKWIHSYV